jgi:hypothetical protein
MEFVHSPPLPHCYAQHYHVEGLENERDYSDLRFDGTPDPAIPVHSI